MLITSSQNNALKRLRSLYKDKKLRQAERVIIAEGVNLVKDIPSDYTVREVFVKDGRKEELNEIYAKFNIEPYILTDSLFDAVSETVTPSGIIALVEKPQQDGLVEGDTVILADGISDAGNLGTIIRTAAARGIKTVICASCTDVFSPKSVRAAMSGTFRTKIFETNRTNALRLLDGYNIIGLDMGANSIYSYKKEGKTAIAVGNEAHGLSEEIKLACKDFISIPMEGGIESLNAAVSVAIAMYLIR